MAKKSLADQAGELHDKFVDRWDKPDIYFIAKSLYEFKRGTKKSWAYLGLPSDTMLYLNKVLKTK